jgi:hypothetical protein
MYLRASSKRRADVSVFTRILRASEKGGQDAALYYAPPRHVPVHTSTHLAGDGSMTITGTDATDADSGLREPHPRAVGEDHAGNAGRNKER